MVVPDRPRRVAGTTMTRDTGGGGGRQLRPREIVQDRAPNPFRDRAGACRHESIRVQEDEEERRAQRNTQRENAHSGTQPESEPPPSHAAHRHGEQRYDQADMVTNDTGIASADAGSGTRHGIRLAMARTIAASWASGPSASIRSREGGPPGSRSESQWGGGGLRSIGRAGEIQPAVG